MKTNLKSFALGASLALGLLGVYALAVSIPNIFAGGEVISAAKMNANFEALKTAVNALEANSAQPTTASFKVSGLTGQTNTTAKTYSQFNVTAPGPGKLLVNMSIPMFLNLPAPPTSGSFKVGLCDAADTGTVGACAGTYYGSYSSPAVQFASVVDISRTRVFDVAAAGVKTIFINAQTNTATHPLSFNEAGTVSVVFIPNTTSLSIASLGTQSQPVACPVSDKAQGRC